jgi:acyl-CoA synthetase (AMP-forming)/AMP-acid ligase II
MGGGHSQPQMTGARGQANSRRAARSVVPVAPAHGPFDASDVERGADGIARYPSLPDSLAHMLREHVERDPSACALVELGGGSLTYGELWERCARVAGGLRAEGAKRGERIAIRMPNGIDWVLAFLGAQLAGAVAVPVNPLLTPSEVRHIAEDSRCRAMVESGASLPDGRPFAVEDARAEELAAIFYTSGTTGAPKGAMISHENFLTSGENCLRLLRDAGERGPEMSSVVSLPLIHVVACNSQLIPMLQAGARAELLHSPLDFEGLFEAIAEHRVKHIVSVPAVYHALLHHPRFAELDVSGVTWASSGGAPMPASLLREIQQAFPHAYGGDGYGLTECSGVATFIPHREAQAHPGSVGYALPVVDLALSDADRDSGVGELLIRGPNLAQGYWRDPAATSETFAAGWLHSGDLARVDEQGCVYVVDRAKDMISRGGENVYSLEVENVLAAGPGVAEVAVVPVPDEMMGEKVGAVIVPAAGAEIDVEALIWDSSERLARFKLPEYLVLRDDPLPRNASGKVLKGTLKTHTRWEKLPARRRPRDSARG